MRWNPTCVRTCAVKLAACEKLLLQSGHLKWERISNNKNRPINVFMIPFVIYRYGRSPLWVRRCVFNVLGRA